MHCCVFAFCRPVVLALLPMFFERVSAPLVYIKMHIVCIEIGAQQIIQRQQQPRSEVATVERTTKAQTAYDFLLDYTLHMERPSRRRTGRNGKHRNGREQVARGRWPAAPLDCDREPVTCQVT